MIGNSLDGLLTKDVLSLKKYRFEVVDELNVIDKWQLAKLIAEQPINFLSNIEMYRAYHPTYFMGYINANKTIKGRRIEQRIESTNAQYYLELFYKVLSGF